MLNIYIFIAFVSIIISICLFISIATLIIIFFPPKEIHLNYRKDSQPGKILWYMETNCGNTVPAPEGEYEIENESYFSLRKKLVDLKKEAEENGLTKECEEEIRKLTEKIKEIENQTATTYKN